MGQEKKTFNGLSKISFDLHMGILYQCDLIQRSRKFIRRKLIETIASKVALVARFDSFAKSSNKYNIIIMN